MVYDNTISFSDLIQYIGRTFGPKVENIRD